MRSPSASILIAMATAAVFLVMAVWSISAFAYKGAAKPVGVINESMIENADSIVIKLNPKGEITFFNNFAQKFFGYPEKEILGKSALGIIIPKTDSSGKDLQPMIEDLFRNPRSHVTNENENIRRNGDKVWVSWVSLPITDKSGKLKELLCVGNVISERK